MKRIIMYLTALYILTLALPVAIYGAGSGEQDALKSPESTESAVLENAAEAEPEPPGIDAATVISVTIDGRAEELSLDVYLEGVLAAEMPASFPEEALRAQVVAARSFIKYRIENPPGDGIHDDTPLCNDPAHCKAYRDVTSVEVAAAIFGTQSAVYLEKIRAAVRDTDGIILTYEGQPAMAAFHAISGGMTESAETVWGSAVPYLVEVESPGEEDALKFREEQVFDTAQLRGILEDAYPGAVLGDNAEAWLGDTVRSAAGTIKSASLGGVNVTGMELRKLLSLNSADFTIEERGGQTVITTTGYGHGVGMSQYGARAMAKEGAGFLEILTHYYPGCELASIADS